MINSYNPLTALPNWQSLAKFTYISTIFLNGIRKSND